jgi:cytochrome c-type protein NapC
MDFTRQSQRAAQAHARYLETGERTCIDCDKGIAHRLPELRPAAAPGSDRGPTPPG